MVAVLATSWPYAPPGAAAAAADDVSIAVSQLFGRYGQEFQTVSNQLAAFHTEFVRTLNRGAAAYLNTESANGGQLFGQIEAGQRAVSAAAAASPVVGPAAAAVASRSVEPMAAKSPAAAATASGTVTTNDTLFLSTGLRRPGDQPGKWSLMAQGVYAPAIPRRKSQNVKSAHT